MGIKEGNGRRGWCDGTFAEHYTKQRTIRGEQGRINSLVIAIIFILISVSAGSAQRISMGIERPELRGPGGTHAIEEPIDGVAIETPIRLPIDRVSIPLYKKPVVPVPPEQDPWDGQEVDDDPADPAKKPEVEKFHWKPAVRQSLVFLGIQHGARMFQEKTTRQLEGPFFKDWGRAVRNLRGWRDGDNTVINYVAHPLQGGLTGRIFVNNSDNASRQEFGLSKGYWKSRAKALVWSAAWSTQFEIGPISEASIGNVGFPRKDGSRSTGYVDYVITPTVGTGVLVGEDAIDKYVLKNWLERKSDGRLTTKVKIFRSLLTPTTSFANILRGKYPWKRYDR